MGPYLSSVDGVREMDGERGRVVCFFPFFFFPKSLRSPSIFERQGARAVREELLLFDGGVFFFLARSRDQNKRWKKSRALVPPGDKSIPLSPYMSKSS